MTALKQRLYKWFNLTTEEELEKIVAFWVIKHKQASDEIDRLKDEASSLMAFDSKKVMTNANGKLFLAGKELTPMEQKILKEEATYISKTELWGIFQNTIADTARKVMFENSKDFDDMRTGKAMLRNLDVQRKIIEIIIQ